MKVGVITLRLGQRLTAREMRALRSQHRVWQRAEASLQEAVRRSQVLTMADFGLMVRS